MSVFSQEEEFGGIHHIKLTSKHSMLRFQVSEIEIKHEWATDTALIRIHIYNKRQDSIYTQKDSSFIISGKSYQEIVDAISNINYNNLLKRLDNMGLDGNSYELQFGNYQNEVMYKIWAPGYYMEEYKTQDFYNACELIIRVAGFTVKDF